jgi:hypothetical protein
VYRSGPVRHPKHTGQRPSRPLQTPAQISSTEQFTDECDVDQGNFAQSWYADALNVMRVLGIVLVAIIGVGLLGPTATTG